MRYTNRVFLPDNQQLYVSDDDAGDERFVELYKQYGDLKVEICEVEFGGKTLSELEPVVETSILKLQNWG